MPILQSDDWVNFYRLRKALGDTPRYRSGSVNINGWDMEYVDAASFISAFDNVVVQRTNDFVSEHSTPFILDCGANIGVSVIHYKRQFPDAKIIAFEPDAKVCQVLRRNLAANNISDVEVVEAAVWKENGETEFFSEGADAGRVDPDAAETVSLADTRRLGNRIKVRTVKLDDFLHEPVDFIKLDIEGAESEVLAASVSKLANVRAIVVEFHLTTSKPKQLGVALMSLAAAGFQVSVNSYGNVITLLNKDTIVKNDVEFDQYLLIHGWR
ncbi:MAG: FkbM family methyltransferase [Acidobacteria bacterium]|nr:FkbM family methyltransferase [Acidobacteriota bacterium]